MVSAAWDWRAVWAVASALLLLAVPFAAGEDLVFKQNDAGSGRDAPDVVSQAITVRPDIMYDGMSTGPFVDRLDFYHFVGEAGKVFVGRAEGNAGCYRLIDEGGNALGRQACSYANTVQTGPVRVELPYSGDYYFLVDHIGPSVYRFGFSLTGAAPEIGIFSYLFGDNGDPATADPLPVPEGCHGDFIYVNGSIGRVAKFTDDCYHMRTGLNNLDTTDIDFLIVPPVSIYPERDLRVMRQAVEMWVHGIHALAPDMGMEWLSAGVDFEIFIDDDNLSTDPLWDPEIVVVATNPVGGLGIGIDPIDALFGGAGPCHGQPNPLAGMDDWKGLDGFDSHHDGRSGTYSTECEGGGSVCFAVNGAIDPAPGFVASFGLYDLVAHEIGHCLTIGHVGDARDHKANAVPFADIMAYTDQDHDKCVSTLDVEGFALAMSRFLLNTSLGANDGASAAWGSFQIQHPDDHRYASPTGLAEDCEQPDADLVPGGSPGVISGQDDAGSGRDAPHDVSKAITIEPDVVYEGMSPGFILDTYDVYHFTGQAGQVFKGLSDGNTGCYSVLDAQGNYSAEKSACSYGTALNTGPIVFELPYTGDYYFKVNHVAPALYRFGFSLSGDPPVVRLLDQVPGGNPVPGQDDAGSGRDAPNDVSQAITIEPDVVYEGMSPGFGLDTYDVYHFTGQAGQVFKGLSDGNTGCYSVLDAQGNYSAEKNACSFGIALNTGPIVFELPYTGDYYFKVNHLAPAVYRFGFSLSGDPPVVRSLDQLPGGNPVPGQDDAGSGRDAPHGVSQAITIEPDVMYEGMSTGLVLDTYDVYHFVGQAGQVFKGMSDGNLGCYSVLDAEGNSSEARACSFGIALNTGPIVFELPYTGDYYFKVDHAAPAVYRFGFSVSDDPPPVGLLDQLPGGNPVPGQDDAGSGRDAPNDVSQAITIEPDVVYEGMSTGLVLDTDDVYHFVGQAGQVFKGLSDGNLGCYFVLDAQGNYTGEDACSFGIALNSGPIVFELPYTGDYYFKVNHLAPAVYRFGFSLSGDAPSVRLLDQV